MIPRRIVGPQEKFERTGAESLRDTRSVFTKVWGALMSEGSGLVLGAGAIVMFVEPASVNLVVPVSLVYASLVLTRKTRMPLRLPKSARVKDWDHPDPDRRPRLAAGTIYLGRDVHGKEVWISSDDGCLHATIPGTTGAGKTTAILSFLVNPLSHGSGFVLVDGKGDQKLYGEVLALARRFGREDDVLCLNFMVASGAKESNSFNPFATGNADAIREMVVSQLGEQSATDSNGVFRGRAVALIGAIVPVLVWLRDNKGIAIDIEKIRDALELRVIWKLAKKDIFESRDSVTGRTEDIEVSIPPDILYPLQAYLGEIPGYDTTLDYNKQKSDKPSEQHGYARFYFTAMFTQLAVSLGHIFKVKQGDIDMRDIVLNRRILVVSLPALENSSDTLAGLGKIVVASLRGMMAQMLEWPAEALDPAAPFHVVLDELGYYATGDLDRMLAQGRSLNIMFWLSFQEIGGIYARIGEKMDSLLDNASLRVGMRLEGGGRTKRWMEETAGQTYVTQATSYQGDGGDGYIESKQADVRQVARIDWEDLKGLIEGEAIITFRGRRIYAKLFYAAIDKSGPRRINRPLVLEAPDGVKIKARRDHILEVARAIESGACLAEQSKTASEPASETLGAVLTAVANARATAAAAAGGRPDARKFEREAWFAAALAAAKQHPHEVTREEGRAMRGGAPHTLLTTMFETALAEGAVAGKRVDGVKVGSIDHRDASAFKAFVAIERMVEASGPRALGIAGVIAGERQLALKPLKEIQNMTRSDKELAAAVGALSASLDGIRTSVIAASPARAAE